MMSLNHLETQALGSIADGLAGSDPRLAASEEMPAREKTRARRRRSASHVLVRAGITIRSGRTLSITGVAMRAPPAMD